MGLLGTKISGAIKSKAIALSAALFLFAGCTTGSVDVPNQTVSFDYVEEAIFVPVRQSYVANEASLDIQTQADGTVITPLVESPAKLLATLVEKRVEPQGGNAYLSFKIEKARLIEQDIDQNEDDFWAAFRLKNSKKLYGEFVVLVEKLNARKQVVKGHRIMARRTTSVPAGASIRSQEDIRFELTQDLMKDFDQKMSDILRMHYAR